MLPKHFVGVCFVVQLIFVFIGISDGAPAKGCKKSIPSLSQEAKLEAQVLTDPVDNRVYHANSIDAVTLLKKKSNVEKKSKNDDCGQGETGVKKEIIENKGVNPNAKSGIIKLDTKQAERFLESIQIDENENDNKNVKKSTPSLLVSSYVAEQKERIQLLQSSIHKNLLKLFHHLKHSHAQNSLADQEEVAQAKEALIADAKKMTALDHDRSPAENFLRGLSNNTLISKMLQNNKPKSLGNQTGIYFNAVTKHANSSGSNAKSNINFDSSFKVKTSEGGEPVKKEENSDVEIITSGDLKTSDNEIKSGNETNAVDGSKVGNQGNYNTDHEVSSYLGSSHNDISINKDAIKQSGNENKVKNGDHSKITLSDIKRNGSSNTSKTGNVGKFKLDEDVTRIKVKQVTEKNADAKPAKPVKHDPYAEIAASPDDPKMPPSIKLPKEGPFIPVGLPKTGSDENDDEPLREKAKERQKDRGRGEGAGDSGAFIPPQGDFEGQSEAPGQGDLTMAGTINPDIADRSIMNSMRNEAFQAELQDQMQEQAMEERKMRVMSGMMGRGGGANVLGGGLGRINRVGGMRGMTAMAGMRGIGAMEDMDSLGGMGEMDAMRDMVGMAGIAGAGRMGGINAQRMAPMGEMGGVGEIPGGIGGIPGGVPGIMGIMGGMDDLGSMGRMGYMKPMNRFRGMNDMGRMLGMAEDDDGEYERRESMQEEPSIYRRGYGYDERLRNPHIMEQTGVSRDRVPTGYARALDPRYHSLYNTRYFNDDDDDYDDDDGDGETEVEGDYSDAIQRDREPEPHRYEDLQFNDDEEQDDEYDPENERKTKIAKAIKTSSKSNKKARH